MNLNINTKILILTLFWGFLSYSCICKKSNVKSISIVICIFLLFKWISDYRKCTFGYLECKIRNVNKNDGYINNILDTIYDINKINNSIYIYIIVVIIIIYNYIRIK